MKNQDGITLIALSITIILLLILAGISLGLLTGNEGIIKKTKDAKENYLYAKDKEALDLMVMRVTSEKMGKATIKEIYEAFRDDMNQENKKDRIVDSIDYPNEPLTGNENHIILTTVNGNRFIYDVTTEKISKYIEKIWAEMVQFTPEDPNWNVENVQQALDYLYERINNN